jgi:hypothetical protein
MEKSTNRIDYKIVFAFIAFAFLFVFLNSKCSPLYLFNEWGDPNIYFSMGKGALNGKVLYKDIFDHKGPLIFFVYAIGYLISNDTFVGIYVLESIALFFNLFFAYKLASLFLNKQCSFITALIYSLFLFNKTYLGGSAEEFISPILLASFYYFICYFRDDNIARKKGISHMFLQGALFALVLLTKLNICIIWVPLVIAIGYQLLIQKEYKKIALFALSFVGGVIVVFLPFILYFGINSALNDFYFGYVTFNSLYAEFEMSLHTIRKIVGRFAKQILSDYISFPLTLLGVFLLSCTKIYIKKTAYRVGILLSFACSYIMIVIVPYVMTYALIIIYICALLAVIFLLDTIVKYIRIKSHPAIYIIAIVAIIVLGINQKRFFNQDMDCLTRKVECNYMQKEFAEIINKEQSPTLLDLGLDHGVFTKANLVPQYKYFFSPNIPYEIFPEIVDYQTNLIIEGKPMFLVFGNTTPARKHFFETIDREGNYELINTYKQNIGAFDTEVYLYKRKEE